MGERALIICLLIFALLSSTQASVAEEQRPAVDNVTLSSCPLTCHCQLTERAVNCSARNLSLVPSDMPVNLLTVDLSRNQIGHLSYVSLKSFLQAREVDLSFNAIVGLSPEVFWQLPELQKVWLKHCLLTSTLLQDVRWPNILFIDLSENRLSTLPRLGNQVREIILDNNVVTEFSRLYLDHQSNLSSLSLVNNSIEELTLVWGGETHGLLYLDVSFNRINHITSMSLDGFTGLRVLNMNNNRITYLPVDLFARLSNLEVLRLSGNQLTSLPDAQFSGCESLRVLDVSQSFDLLSIGRPFDGLSKLEVLNLSSCPQLRLFKAEAFSDLSNLSTLAVSESSMFWLQRQHMISLPVGTKIMSTNSTWMCDCNLAEFLPLLNLHLHWANKPICSQPVQLLGRDLLDVRNYENCPRSLNYDQSSATILVSTSVNDAASEHREFIVEYSIGSSAMLLCSSRQMDLPVQWLTPRNVKFLSEVSALSSNTFISVTLESMNIKALAERTGGKSGDRISLLENGSLVIREVARSDAGRYICSWGNHSQNESHLIHFRLDYDIIFTLKIQSIIFGWTCAGAFLVFGILVCFSQYLHIRCSDEERQKRRSIKQLLERIQDYKTEKMGKFSAYRSAKIGQLSAYRTAKIGKIRNYRTAKLDKLFAFKTAKLDKLRTYKQMTMTSILHHMDRMREHYAMQSGKVKENCVHQAVCLRHRYHCKMSRFKDYRSHQIDRLRDNYHGQMTRIHEYGSQQMEKLREQYRVQQQYIVKLMELLDIGNCISVVDAECLRTESMLFDPTLNVPIDFDGAQFAGCGDDANSMKESNGSSIDGDDYMTASIGEHSLEDDLSMQGMNDGVVEFSPAFHLGDDDSQSECSGEKIHTVSGALDAGQLELGLNDYEAHCSRFLVRDNLSRYKRDRDHLADSINCGDAFSGQVDNTLLNDGIRMNGYGDEKKRAGGKGKESSRYMMELYLYDTERMNSRKGRLRNEHRNVTDLCCVHTTGSERAHVGQTTDRRVQADVISSDTCDETGQAMVV